MATIVLNDELSLSYPESFHLLDETEKNRLNFAAEGKCECLSDTELHILMSFGWKPLRGLTSVMIGTQEAAVNMEKKISKPMRAFGYRLLGRTEILLDGAAARGFRYTYAAQGIEMLGEAFAFRRNKTVYYLYLYARSALQEESLAVWDEILASVKWVK